MYRQLNITDLFKGIKERIETSTPFKCYDIPPENAPSPLVIMDLIRMDPADTKTMYVKKYTVNLHVIGAPRTGSEILNHLTEIQEAMTEEIQIPECFNLLSQDDLGIQSIYTDETGERHAILSYMFTVNYGLKIK